MASATATDFDDELNCSVCHEHFIEPKLLPCGHLLCRNCLLSWIQSKTDAKCPICRSLILETEERGSQSLEDVSDGFPTDLSMVQLVEAKRLLRTDHQCCACKDAVATCLCLNCRDLMCKSCAKIHRNFSMAKNHIVEELSILTPEKLAADSRPSPCAHHASEVTTLYCPTHDDSICHVCAVTRHRSCLEVKELEEKMSEARSLLGELMTKLNEGLSLMDQSIEQLEQHLQEMEKKMQTLIQEIDETCDRLESAVKECRRHLKELVQNACSEVKEAVQEGKTHLLQRKGKLTCHKIVAERVQEMKAPDDVTSMTSVMEKRVDDMEYCATLPADAKVIYTVTLEIGPEAVSSLEKMLRELDVKCVPAEVNAQPEATNWSFHDNHGANIVLSNGNQTADRITGTTPHHGIVIGCDPMEVDTLYQVEMNEVLTNWNYEHNMLGVALQDPHTISLPIHVYTGCSFAILINYKNVFNLMSPTSSSLGAPLRDVRAGSHVGLLVNKKRELHLYVDGKDLGVVAPEVPKPCFILFDLLACWKK